MRLVHVCVKEQLGTSQLPLCGMCARHGMVGHVRRVRGWGLDFDVGSASLLYYKIALMLCTPTSRYISKVSVKLI